MKKKPIIIGTEIFKFKKDALSFYKNILNSYDFDQNLSEKHFDNIVSLLEFGQYYDTKNSNLVEYYGIKKIFIGKVQYNTKCFQIEYDDNSIDIISYRLLINQPKITDFDYFVMAARNAVKDDINNVKRKYFEVNSTKGIVKCQETGELSEWKDLVVDHRQPNTFSIIIDRFIEVNKMDFSIITYKTDENNFLQFESSSLKERFREYHKTKATLRIVRKELNLSRTNLARVKKQNNDLIIE